MPIGQQPSVLVIDSALTSYALQMRDLMRQIRDFNLQIGKLGAAGLVALQPAGYSPADASNAVAMAATLATPATLYFGTATQATTFNFNDALSPLWAGQ